MGIPLDQKIAQLKIRYQGEHAVIDILNISDILLSMVDQVRGDLAVVSEGQVATDYRLNELEKKASSYREPRG